MVPWLVFAASSRTGQGPMLPVPGEAQSKLLPAFTVNTCHPLEPILRLLSARSTLARALELSRRASRWPRPEKGGRRRPAQ